MVVSTDEAAMAACAMSLDLIIDTVAVAHDLALAELVLRSADGQEAPW